MDSTTGFANSDLKEIKDDRLGQERKLETLL